MEFKHRLSNTLWSLFLLLCITRVCHGQLMCYVCENCSQVNKQTPLIECNEDFFNPGGTTDSSIQTTTDYPRTTESATTKEKESSVTPTVTEEITTTTTTTSTTEMPTTTDEPTTEVETTPETTKESTKETTTTEMTTEKSTTEELPPTPATVGPPMTTTTLPTPPNPGPLKPIDDVEVLNNRTQQVNNENVDKMGEVDGVEIMYPSTKAYKPSAEFRVRQLRAVSDVTYHCFKIQAQEANGTVVINRGCSRVATMQSVCGLWKEQHPMETINKCEPCSRSQCNGSTALNVSITALFVALVAVVMHRI